MLTFKSNRCRICRINRGNRFCLRLGKDICWQDCNLLRVDLKCPEICAYSIRKELVEKAEISFRFKAKTDSSREYRDLLQREMDRWLLQPQPVLNNRIPLELAEEAAGKEQIARLFNEFKIPDYIPLIYLKERLKIDKLKVKSQPKTHEEFAEDFLALVVTQEWEKTISLLAKNEKYEKPLFRNNYFKRLQDDRFINKIREYSLISSALDQPVTRALVHFDINRRYDLTLVLVRNNTDWLMEARIYGRPELYHGMNEAHQQVAVLLSKNESGRAFKLLNHYQAIYIDSADLYYYRGLYYAMQKNYRQAVQHFLSASELDPGFLEARYNYAYMLQVSGEKAVAREAYLELMQPFPRDVRILNNLASLAIEDKNFSEAEELLQKCLRIDPQYQLARDNLARLEKLHNE